MTFEELGELADRMVDDAEEVTNLRNLGLDPRSAKSVWVGKDFLAVMRRDDPALRNFSMFSGVDNKYRAEFGGFVFYSTEDKKVRRHHDIHADDDVAVICSSCNGSGEGMYDGKRCWACGGSGEMCTEGD